MPSTSKRYAPCAVDDDRLAADAAEGPGRAVDAAGHELLGTLKDFVALATDFQKNCRCAVPGDARTHKGTGTAKLEYWRFAVAVNFLLGGQLIDTCLHLGYFFRMSLLLHSVAGVATLASAAETKRPNVVVFLADDMGYSDLGCYGGEIETPNLDGLAKNGLRFTQFYNTARCWPTRAALLTGYYAQQVRRDALPGVRSGGQGVRPAWAKLLPEMLKPLGYRSYHSGKWHVDGKVLRWRVRSLVSDAGPGATSSTRRIIRRMTSRCRRCSARAAITRRRRLPIMRSRV